MRKILILAANPEDTTPLHLGEEVRDINECLRRAKHGNAFTVEQRWAVRPRDLQWAMLEESPQIVHFSGHGAGDAGLYFQDNDGNAKLVAGEALARLFQLVNQKSQITCVLLNGCYSKVQAEAIVEYVPYVIGMNASIKDRAAIEFAVGFYFALGNGQSVEFAFNSGKVAMGLNSTGDYTVPELLKGQKQKQISTDPASKHITTQLSSPHNLPRSGIESDKFVGRVDEFFWLQNRLKQYEQVEISALSGMGGIGKTELALRYALANQNDYSGGICWIEARDKNIGSQVITFAEVYLNLNLPKHLDSELHRVHWCWQNWPPGNTLIIFDDVVNYAHIKSYLPPAKPYFRILITTRRKLLQESSRLELHVLQPDDAISFLKSLIGKERVQTESTIAKQICRYLGYLPLGLELVGRYLARQSELSLANMLTCLQTQGNDQKALQKPESEADMTAQFGVSAAFELSWNELSPIAQELGCLFSIFDVVPIPWALVERCFPNIDPEELETARDDYLKDLHLIQHEGKDIYKLHELIRDFFQRKLIKLTSADSLQEAITQKIAALVKHNPILIIDFFKKRILSWIWSMDTGLPPALQTGELLITAYQAWAEGIGPLSQITLPHRDDGSLPSLGIRFRQNYESQLERVITYSYISWNSLDSVSAPVIELPPEIEIIVDRDISGSITSAARSKLSDDGWVGYKYSGRFTQQASWPWQEATTDSIKALTRLIQERRLPVEQGCLSREAAWCAAWSLMMGNFPKHRASFIGFRPIHLKSIEAKLATFDDSSFSGIMWHCVKQLKIELEYSKKQGDTYFKLPPAIEQFKNNSGISPELSLAYATHVYGSALEEYQRLIEHWFPKFLSHFYLANFLPVRLRGWVIPPNNLTNEIGLALLWEPLPSGCQSSVDFKLSDSPPNYEAPDIQSLLRQQSFLRPRYTWSALMETYGHPTCLDIDNMLGIHACTWKPFSRSWLGTCPITKLVYKWLWNDLVTINLIKGRLDDFSSGFWRWI